MLYLESDNYYELKKEGKTVFFVTTAICCLIILTGSVYSSNSYDELKNTFLSSSHPRKKSIQEQGKYRFVGMEKCASVCHNNDTMGFQYNIVKRGPHSKAFQVLLSEKAKTLSLNTGINGEPSENAVCLKCHITGSGLDSSFFAPTYRKEEGITCEACHKGAYKTKTYIPQEADCLICHNNSVHETPVFNYKLNCGKIAHPRPKKT